MISNSLGYNFRQETIDKGEATIHSETCMGCGFNLLVPTGTCKTCPMCGSSTGCS